MNRRYPLVALIGTQALDSYNISYNNLGKPLQVGEAALARQGRIGLVFFFIGLCCFFAGNKLYFPKEQSKKEKDMDKKRIYLAEKHETWKPTLWRRSNLMFSCYTFATLLVLLVEYSLSQPWNLFMWTSVIVLKFFWWFFDFFIVYQLQEVMLCEPLRAAMNFGMLLFELDRLNKCS